MVAGETRLIMAKRKIANTRPVPQPRQQSKVGNNLNSSTSQTEFSLLARPILKSAGYEAKCTDDARHALELPEIQLFERRTNS